MIKQVLLYLVFILTFQVGFGQYIKLSPQAEVSIITAGPGEALYEGFGHSTIRIKDKEYDFDLAYNYGVFDFNAPNFYLNFLKGNLQYKLERYPFYAFVRGYNKQQRWIKEQVLNLTQSEKQQFFEYLEENAKPENANYSYDPFFNNCASKLREITDKVLKDSVVFNASHLKEKKTIRELMNKEIPWNSWGSFGINVALGTGLDKVASEMEHMYLPDYVMFGFENASVKRGNTSIPLVKKENIILKYEELSIDGGIHSPLSYFLLLMVIGIIITYKDLKRNSRTKWIDVSLLLSTGLIGLIICFLWFFTDHSTAPNNFNFLWAFAPNTVVAFYLRKNQVKNWVRGYIKGLILLLIIIPFIWIGKIQLLPTAILPFLILLIVRYVTILQLLTSKK